MADVLLSSPAVFDFPSSAQMLFRQEALCSLCPLLQLQSIVQWNRAVGRILDVGPSQLHAYYILYALQQSSSSSNSNSSSSTISVESTDTALVELVNTMNEAVPKMKALHIDALLLLIAGVSATRVEELKKFTWSFYREECAIRLPIHTIEVLISAIIERLTHCDSKISSTNRINSSFSSTTSSAMTLEVQNTVKLAEYLLSFRRGVNDLPGDILTDLLDTAFGRDAIISEFIERILLREAVSGATASYAVEVFQTDYTALCQLLCGGRVSPMNRNEGITPTSMLDYLQSTWTTALSGIQNDNTSDTMLVFLEKSSDLRALSSKAKTCLSGAELLSFTQCALGSASALEINPPWVLVDASHCSSIAEVFLLEMDSWVSGDAVLFSKYAQAWPLYSAIHALTHLGMHVKELSVYSCMKDIITVRALLLSRCILYALYQDRLITVQQLNAIHLYCNDFVSNETVSSRVAYNIQSPKLWVQLLQTLFTYMELLDNTTKQCGIKYLIILLRLHQHVCTAVTSDQHLLLFPAPLSVQFTVSGLNNLQNHTKSPLNIVNTVLIDLHLYILKQLQQHKMYEEFIEFLLLDVFASTGGSLDYNNAELIGLIEMLPDSTCWKRQVGYILTVVVLID